MKYNKLSKYTPFPTVTPRDAFVNAPLGKALCVFSMSTKLKIDGYEKLNKVATTKAFREFSGEDLEGAKRMTDSLLKNGTLEFEIEDNEKAEKLLQKLRAANANVSSSK